jgi:ABC-2 type transport system ATP-binding protein
MQLRPGAVAVNPAIRIENLTKLYGSDVGVRDLTFSVTPGEVFGYLGPNGAGKTTTIRLILDLIRPSSGRIEVLGLDSRRDSVAVRRRLGYVPGDLALYEGLTGREHLNYFASLRGGIDWAYVDALAERLDLDLSRQVRQLSKGNKQKVGLVQAFMHRPELVVLDEPTAGLDPLMQQEFYRLVRERTADGGTVFLSSHVLAEVEHVADRVGIIREGELAVVEEVRALKEKALRRVDVTFVRPVTGEAFSAVPGLRAVEVDGASVVFSLAGSVDPLVKALARFEVETIATHEPDLEEIFLAYYRRGEPRAA